MKLKIFDRKKYIESVNRLTKRKAPDYIVEAYLNGFSNVVNHYYNTKYNRAINKSLIKESKKGVSWTKLAEAHAKEYPFLSEALNRRDEEFLKAFFIMTNLDIVTGKKLERNAGKILKTHGVVGLKNLYTKEK